MAQPSPTASKDDVANPPKLTLHLGTSSKALISDPLLVLYEHIENLRERGREEEAKNMDESEGITDFCQIIGSKALSKAFNNVWSATALRAALYEAVAPQLGGPKWLRETIKISDVEEMSSSRIPDVWEGLFQKAKALTGILFAPAGPASSHAAQVIGLTDLHELKKLCRGENGRLDLPLLQDLFFPTVKASKKSQIQQQIYDTYSSVMAKHYQHGRSTGFMKECEAQYWGQVFDCLARHAKNGTPLAHEFDCLTFTNLASTSGKVTGGILSHIMFWFNDLNDSKRQLDHQSQPWTDLLGATPFSYRHGSSDDVTEGADEPPEEALLEHVDKPSAEATKLFVQALFDLTRRFDRNVNDWKDLATQSPKAFFSTVSYLSPESRATCYRQRFQHQEWLQILYLVRSYTRFPLEGCMEIYNEMSITPDRYPQISMSAGIEQALLAAKLACPPDLLFLETETVRGEFLSEAKTFVAAFLYRCAKGDIIASSARASAVQQKAPWMPPAIDATAQAILTDTSRILQDAGFHPEPANLREDLLQYIFRPPAILPLRLSQSQRDETVDYGSGGVFLSDSQLEPLSAVPNGEPIDDEEIDDEEIRLDFDADPEALLDSESPSEEGLETPSKKRKRSGQK